MDETTTTAVAQSGEGAHTPVAQWRDDYKATDKTTTFREDWEALLGAINPRFARHGRAASIIWPLSILALGLGLIAAFSSNIDWKTLPLKSAGFVLTVAAASLYWPHRIVRYFNLDGLYPRPSKEMSGKERRLRLLYKLYLALLVVLWGVIAFTFATIPATPDTPPEGRLTTVVEMFFFLALIGCLPWLVRWNNKTEAEKILRKREADLKAIEAAPKTIAEAQERLEAEIADGHLYP